MSDTPSFDGSRETPPHILRAVWLPILLMGVFIALSAFIRPVIPPDETRYLTAAWEMLVRGDFVLPTINFAPYHDKPPMLFWTIDVFWGLFGVSRWAALLAIFVISSGVVLVSRALAAELFPGDRALANRVPWLLVGNGVFVVYCGLVMFDLLLTFFVGVAILSLVKHARAPSRTRVWIAGLATGCGVITKGPVVLLFLVPLMAAYPLWKGERYTLANKAFFKACGLAVAIAFVPVLVWLLPLAYETGPAYMKSLVWGQAAHRVTGSMKSSHARPLWFYLPLLPLFLLPWLFSVHAWQARAERLKQPWTYIKTLWRERPQVRFIVMAIVPSVVLFSLVSGKQPHYLEPLFPVVTAALALFMRPVRFRLIEITTVSVLAAFVVGQAVAALWVLPLYDLSKPAGVLAVQPGPLAVVGHYQGEFGFMARLKKPIEEIGMGDAAAWLKAHPDGAIVGLERSKDAVMPGRVIFKMPYRSSNKTVVIVQAKPAAQTD